VLQFDDLYDLARARIIHIAFDSTRGGLLRWNKLKTLARHVSNAPRSGTNCGNGQRNVQEKLDSCHRFHRLVPDDIPGDWDTFFTIKSFPLDSDALAICRSIELLILAERDFCNAVCFTAAAFFGGIERCPFFGACFFCDARESFFR